MTSSNPITVLTTSDDVLKALSRGHFVNKSHNFQNIIVQLHWALFRLFPGEWHIFSIISNRRRTICEKHQMQQHRCGAAIVLLQYASLCSKKFLFIGQGTCSFICKLNFSCPLLQMTKTFNKTKAVENCLSSNAMPALWRFCSGCCKRSLNQMLGLRDPRNCCISTLYLPQYYLWFTRVVR